MTSHPTFSSVYLTDQSVIAGYNRGPITSVFSAPASCTTILIKDDTRTYFGHYLDYYQTECYPTGTRAISQLASYEAWNAYYYSPAICPSGWSTATMYQSLFPRLIPDIALGSQTTAALCCPSGYSDVTGGHLCGSLITSGQSVLVRALSSGTPFTETATTSAHAYGDGVPIWWQSSDLQVLARASGVITSSQATLSTSSAPGSAVSKNTSTPTNFASTPAPTSSTSSPSPPSGGFPLGAKIGLGVGIPVALLAGLVIGILLLRRRPRHPATTATSSFHGPGSARAILRWMANVPAKSVGTTTATSEVGGESRVAQQALEGRVGREQGASRVTEA